VRNSFEEEMKERIVLGTKAYYANLKFFRMQIVQNAVETKII